MTIWVLNGPNLNLLGLREPTIYGHGTYADLVALLESGARARGIDIRCLQMNGEGALVDAIQAAYGVAQGLILNPAAYTHTSVAILDAVKAVGIPTVEVHLTDPDTREPFRRIAYVREACIATIKGKGFAGYLEAMDLLIARLERQIP